MFDEAMYLGGLFWGLYSLLLYLEVSVTGWDWKNWKEKASRLFY